jgi:hypothetical protein
MSKKTYSIGFPFNRKELKEELKSEPLKEGKTKSNVKNVLQGNRKAPPPPPIKNRATFFICAEKVLKDAEFYSERGERTIAIEQLEILRRLINKEI